MTDEDITFTSDDVRTFRDQYSELALAVLTDEVAQNTVDTLAKMYPHVPRPMINGVSIVGCAETIGLRLEAVIQFLDMLNEIFSDATAEIAVTASIAAISHDLEFFDNEEESND